MSLVMAVAPPRLLSLFSCSLRASALILFRSKYWSLVIAFAPPKRSDADFKGFDEGAVLEPNPLLLPPLDPQPPEDPNPEDERPPKLAAILASSSAWSLRAIASSLETYKYMK